jgi:hypothetical protein
MGRVPRTDGDRGVHGEGQSVFVIGVSKRGPLPAGIPSRPSSRKQSNKRQQSGQDGRKPPPVSFIADIETAVPTGCSLRWPAFRSAQFRERRSAREQSPIHGIPVDDIFRVAAPSMHSNGAVSAPDLHIRRTYGQTHARPNAPVVASQVIELTSVIFQDRARRSSPIRRSMLSRIGPVPARKRVSAWRIQVSPHSRRTDFGGG